MNDLSFEIEVRWSGTGREGAGEIHTNHLALELSAPESMEGRGVGTNPEELLVCAVSSCYTATLFRVLHRAKLPVDSVTVAARGTVTGSPGRVRFAGIRVSPTLLGGDIVRQTEYETAAHVAHDRCLIGRTLAPEVDYEVGPVRVLAAVALRAAADMTRPAREHEGAPRNDPAEHSPAGRAA